MVSLILGPSSCLGRSDMQGHFPKDVGSGQLWFHSDYLTVNFFYLETHPVTRQTTRAPKSKQKNLGMDSVTMNAQQAIRQPNCTPETLVTGLPAVDDKLVKPPTAKRQKKSPVPVTRTTRSAAGRLASLPAGQDPVSRLRGRKGKKHG